MPLTAVQKTLSAQFVQMTATNDKVAQKFLKNANWKLDVAADAYFSSNPSMATSSSSKPKLDKMFSDLQDTQEDSPDELGAGSAIEYASSLGVDPESVGIFVLMELVKAPAFGVITRSGFIEGWQATNAPASKSGQKDYIQSLIRNLPHDHELFKRVYRHAFIAGRETPEQRALPLENALVYWQCFFGSEMPHSKPWVAKSSQSGGTTDFLDLWTEYLKNNWSRTVSKDMWNQTLDFAVKSTADSTLSFWTPEGSWPSVIDGFVEWLRSKGIGVASGMEVDS
ncbi:Scaffold-type E3 ligase [Pyricularia grisea]|uniref:Defective in cullin neddylation protein n=1 Tax=Pyricularia grisea TaxID=148305 RepID=A0A6P8BFL0_PYRGI|nr:uncharacterized protein PgNI_01167 [Pyricularia grisea]KAI6353086.1 Scaffold-type E3 ligase [Pyricularia grisea]TLD15505.1 hypothetical protein PgNI_01167 [Pyricularia grisea]